MYDYNLIDCLMPKMHTHKPVPRTMLIRSSIDRLQSLGYAPPVQVKERKNLEKVVTQSIIDRILAGEIEVEVDVVESGLLKRRMESQHDRTTPSW